MGNSCSGDKSVSVSQPESINGETDSITSSYNEEQPPDEQPPNLPDDILTPRSIKTEQKADEKASHSTLTSANKLVKTVSFSLPAPEKTPESKPVKPKWRKLRRIGRYPHVDESHYFSRREEEIAIKSAITKLLANNKRNNHFLEIFGEESVGKSVLLAHVLFQEDDFLWQDCPLVEYVLWLNVDEIVQEDRGLGKQSVADQMKSPDLTGAITKKVTDLLPSHDDDDDSAADLLNLIVLDFNDIEEIPDKLKRVPFNRSTRFIVISRQRPSSSNSLQIKPLCEEDCRKAIEQDSEAMLQLNLGLPLNEQFKNENEGFDERVQSSFSETFNNLLEKAIAFLLFKPGQGVKARELSLLWGMDKPNDAEQFCQEEFCSHNLLQTMRTVEMVKRDPPSEAEEEKSKRPSKIDFAMTTRLHRGLTNSFKESHLNSLIKEAARSHQLAREGENILHIAVRLKRGLLVKAIASSSDGQLLNELCLERNGDESTVIDYLRANECLLTEKNFKTHMREYNTIAFFEGVAILLDKLAAENVETIDPLLSANSSLELLFFASSEGLVNLAEVTGSKVDDVNTLQREQTALMLAAVMGHETIVRILLKNGADVNKANEASITPLYLAARKGNNDVFKLLLEEGANPVGTVKNTDYRRQFGEDDSALNAAAQFGHTSIVRTLLDDERVQAEPKGRTALLLAARFGQAEIVDLLLSANYDPNAATVDNGDTALTFAAMRSREDIVKLLLDKNAKIDVRSKDDKTPLGFAIFQGRPDIARMLLEKSVSDSKKRSNAIAEAQMFEAINEGDETALDKLLRSGVDPNSCENCIITALNSAVEQRKVAIVKQLLEHDANPNVQTTFKNRKITALMKAVDYGSPGMVEALLKKSADPNLASTEVGTALVYAVKNDNAKIAQLLLEAKADPNVKSVEDDESVLVMAVRNNNDRIVRALLKKGAYSNDVANGKAALAIAEKRGYQKIIDLFQSETNKQELVKYLSENDR